MPRSSPPVDVLKHVRVFYQPGRYGGWPANHGIWVWGDEILVGFQIGAYKAQNGHAIDWDQPIRKVFARSRDGGETWALEDTLPDALDNLVDAGNAAGPPNPHAGAAACPGGIDFSHPGFAMTFSHASFHAGPSRFWTSLDRGHSWAGPYRLPDMDTNGIAARTDYLVNGAGDCTLFLTAAKTNRREGRPLCARTRDGGRTWALQAWIGPEQQEGFAIMPASLRLSPGHILVALRVQQDETRSSIIAWRSDDDGLTWQPATDPVPSLPPSNPPALIRLRDGRLCLTYGVRTSQAPSRICARLSADEGATWGDELILRDDGANRDIGYTRSACRADGSIVTVYYFNDAQSSPDRYIGATIWRAL
ncbi:MAG: glycoside hydrolase [Chloroflexi bacterium]|nr:glycoside hydrolase [Chloroflexota bacterium]